MKMVRKIVVWLVLGTVSVIEGREAIAQSPSQPPTPSTVIPLERVGDPAGASDSRSQPSYAPSGQASVTPSGQANGFQNLGGNSALGNLHNPYGFGASHAGVHATPQAPSAQAGQGQVFPSGQGPSFWSQGGNTALSRLRNPFDWGGHARKHAPMRQPSPQYPPMPGAPGYMPGAAAPGMGGAPGYMPGAAAPGMEGAPGMGAPGAEAAPGAPGAAAPGAAAAGADAFAAAAGAGGPGFGGGLTAASDAFPMIGDQSPIRFGSFQTNIPRPPGTGGQPPIPPPPPGPRAASLFYPSVRDFKIAENMSPRPQDRFFTDFNYYNNVNATINRRQQVPIENLKAYRYLFGMEKTFNDGKGSIGIRFPINNITADSRVPGIQTPTSTAMGNVTVFTKYILEQNVRTGSLVSAGLAVSAPTGPGRFAGAPYLFGLNTVTFQPFLGYIYNIGNWYVQGFSAFDFPGNSRDVTLMYNDVGIGYYLLRSQDPNAFLTAVVPTFEVHVNTPFTHRDINNRFDIAASPDVVNLTYGINFQVRRSAILTTALITPVSSPKPFDTEIAVFLNIFYGRSRAGRIPIMPPPAL